MFRLVRHFSLTSAAAIVAITSIFVLAFHGHEREQVVDEIHARNLVLVRMFSNGLWGRYGQELMQQAKADRAGLRGSPLMKAFDGEFDRLTANVELLKLRILSPEGLIAYSTEEEEIGKTYTERQPLHIRASSEGVSFTSVLEARPNWSQDDAKRSTSIAESYFPLPRPDGGLAAVLEVYTDFGPRAALVRRHVAMMALLISSGFLALYFILLAIVRRADRILRGQYAELGHVNSLLEERVKSRTSELETSAAELGHSNARLRREIDVRRRAEAELDAKRQSLISQQSAVIELIRTGTLDMSRPEHTLQALTEITARTLGVERVSIWLLSEAADRLVCLDLYETGITRHRSGFVLALDTVPIYKSAFLEGDVIAAEDASTHPAMIELSETYIRSRNIASMLDVPVVRGGRVHGVVCSEKVGDPISWTPERQVFAVTIANLVALMLESRDRERAVTENKERTLALIRHHQTLGEVIQDEAFRSGDLASALRAITKGMARCLGVDKVAICLLDRGSEALSYGECYLATQDQFASPPCLGDARLVAALKRTASDGIVAIDDVSRPHALAELNEHLYEPNGVKSVLHAPINVHGCVAGFLTCICTSAQIAWTADHLLAVASVVNLAALALERGERERAEAELRLANQRLEAATKAKSEFLANMSHEIRTPMNAVFGMTDLLGRTTLDARQRRLVGTISQSAKTLLTIVNDILDISRIEAGRLEIELREFDVRHAVERVGELFSEDAQAKGLDCSVFLDKSVPATVIGDEGRLRQILVNLIGNAVKFTSQGEVAVRVTFERPEGRPTRLAVVVRDTGIGIDPAAQDSLFGAFAQADSSISRRFGGTGLGLSISRHLVELMGGEITLSSVHGQGTTVTFSIPAEVGRGRIARRMPAGAEHLSGKRVLVVDKHAVTREIVASYLGECGAAVSEAATEAIALDLVSSAHHGAKPFDVALVDLTMQSNGGLELVRRMKTLLADHLPHLVLLTSVASETEVKAARELAVAAVLAKPIRRFELVEAIAAALVGPDAKGAPTESHPSSPPASWPGRRILVVEDNPVNVEVAREYLEYYRCICEVAHNGLEALAALETHDYDLVLMDVQMPEMDGLTATRRIREREDGLGKPRVPIIGVTANAYDEDRQACIRAGMDGYLGKPFEEAEIRSALARWLKPSVSSGAAIVPKDDGPPALTEGTIAMLEATRPDLLHRMVRVYLDYAPKAVASLRKAIDGRDLIALKLGAHSLKSSSANVGGDVLSMLLRRLETAANAKDEPLARELVADVEQAFIRLRAALEGRVPVRSAPATAPSASPPPAPAKAAQ